MKPGKADLRRAFYGGALVAFNALAASPRETVAAELLDFNRLIQTGRA